MIPANVIVDGDPLAGFVLVGWLIYRAVKAWRARP